MSMTFKIAVRTLVVVMAGCGLLSGCGSPSGTNGGYAQFKQKEDSFIKLVADAGGKAVKENKSMFGLTKSGWMIDLSNSTISDRVLNQLIEVSKLEPIFRLDLNHSKITNDQLAKLDSGKALEKTVELDLSDTAITDQGLDRLSHMCWILTLNLKGSGATKEAGKKLEEKKLANPDTPEQFKTEINIQT